MTKDIFKLPEVQNQFREQGYAIVQLLNAEEIKQLENVYSLEESNSEVHLPFYTSIWSDNVQYKELIDAELKKVLVAALSKHLFECKPVFANFMVKKPGNNNQLIPHQDWSFVDETIYDSVTVWCPIMDTNEFNGNLQVVPRSHCLKNFIRGRFFDAPFRYLFENFIPRHLKDLPMKAGDSVILNSRLIHASPPNYSSTVRVAASIVMAPKEAELIHYVLEDVNTRKSFKKLYVSPRFFTDFSCYDKLETLKSEERFPYHGQEITREELELILNSP